MKNTKHANATNIVSISKRAKLLAKRRKRHSKYIGKLPYPRKEYAFLKPNCLEEGGVLTALCNITLKYFGPGSQITQANGMAAKGHPMNKQHKCQVIFKHGREKHGCIFLGLCVHYKATPKDNRMSVRVYGMRSSPGAYHHQRLMPYHRLTASFNVDVLAPDSINTIIEGYTALLESWKAFTQSTPA